MGDNNNNLSRRARILALLAILFSTGLATVPRFLNQSNLSDSSKSQPGAGSKAQPSVLVSGKRVESGGPASPTGSAPASRDTSGLTSTADASADVSGGPLPVTGRGSAVVRASIQLAEAPQLPPPAPEAKAVRDEYLDPLIDPSIGVDPKTALSSRERTGRSLPGLASIEYRYFDQNIHDGSGGVSIERGVAAQVQQDTENYGRFDMRAAFTNAGSSGIVSSDFNGGHYVNIAQRNFAVTDHWLMNNEIGDIRARSPELFTTSGYIRLPEPLIEGASAELRSPDAVFRVSGGTLGTYQGRTFPVFSTDFSNGSAASVGVSYRLAPQWQAAAQTWQTRNALTVTGADSHGSTAAAVRFDGRDSGKAQLSVLGSDSGAHGVWMDGEKRFAGWLHNLSLYRMDPNLQWVDRNTAVLSDMQGASWRTSTRSVNTYTVLGADTSENNLDHNPATATTRFASVYGNVGYQVSDALSLTGYLLRGGQSTSGAGMDTQDSITTAQGGVSKRFSSGTSSWLLGATNRSGDSGYKRTDASWDHYWNAQGGFNSLHGGVLYSRQTGSTNDFTEASVRGGAGWSLNRLNVSGSATFGKLTSNLIDSNHSSSLIFSLGWRLADAWRLGADLSYSQNLLTTTVAGELRVTDRQLMLSLRYDAGWGRSQSPVGHVNGTYGRGAIRGALFLDRNNNGVRDPGEPGVAGVTIYLDRGFSVETDANGGFSFDAVASGAHVVRFNTANVPLPWEPRDEKPLDVTVHTRETAVVEIPLVNLRPN
ncbi:MAG: SdrD B-like domain-containing protein [Bacteroidota bacterium]